MPPTWGRSFEVLRENILTVFCNYISATRRRQPHCQAASGKFDIFGGEKSKVARWQPKPTTLLPLYEY